MGDVGRDGEVTLRVDVGVAGTGGVFVPANVGSVFADAGYCGHSFNEGLLRFHDSESAPVFREYVRDAFPAMVSADADVVAFDWQGRQIVATSQGDPSDPVLVVADIGRGEVGEFGTLSEFTGILRHDDMVAEVFAEPFYREWKASVGAPDAGLPFADSVGFSVPLYVGGEYTVGNLELVDTDVLWGIGSQIWAQVRDLPPGTPVRLSLD